MNKIFGILFILMLVSAARAQSVGALVVRGEIGKLQVFQKVKAVRCESATRGKCDAPVYFGVGVAQSVKAGSYILGFENSIYPGWVMVEPSVTTTVNLDKLAVPAGISGDKIKVFRDMNSVVEQNKILFSMYQMNRHFFRLDKENFGDLYLTGSWERDFVQRFTYETCARLATYRDVPDAAMAVCQAWNEATHYADLKGIYKFNTDGTMIESWVTFPGDVVPSKHPRYLVSAPMGAQDFVAVFPGVYKFQVDGKNGVSVPAGNFNENF